MFLLGLDGFHVLTSVDGWCCGDCVGLGFCGFVAAVVLGWCF